MSLLPRRFRGRRPASAPERRWVNRHVDRTAEQGYAPSFFEGGPYLNAAHRDVQQAVEGIRGKLSAADHFKLYEAGYFAQGPILEVGRLHGRSTVLLAMGVGDAGRDVRITSIEYEDRYLRPARRHLRRRRLLRYVELVQGDSSTVIRTLPDRFDTVFLDGDHSYEGVIADLDALGGRIERGGVVLFHDFYHKKNETGEYGVRRAVEERAAGLGLAFRGRFGAIALFERVGGGDPDPAASGAAAVPTAPESGGR